MARSSDMRHSIFFRYDSTTNMPGGPIRRTVAALAPSSVRDHLSVASCAFSVGLWWSLVRVRYTNGVPASSSCCAELRPTRGGPSPTAVLK